MLDCGNHLENMSNGELSELNETAQLLLGAFAMADVHTLGAADVEALSGGAISSGTAADALRELSEAGLTEAAPEAGEGAQRLTRAGIELTLKLQQALNRHREDAAD